MRTAGLILGLGMLGVLGAPTQGAAGTIEVVINDLAFSPANLQAKVGDVVRWTNRDVVDHTATAKGAWDVLIRTGQSAGVKLKTAGRIDYVCRYHPNMAGSIIVSRRTAEQKAAR